MNKISSLQATLLVVGCLLATKFKRMSSFIATYAGRDGWVIMLGYLLFDCLFMLIALKIVNSFKDKTLFEIIELGGGKFVAKLIAICFGIYYVMQTLIAYKGTHEFFASNLFDKLSWELFSILFIIVLVFMCTKGLRVIGRSSEFYIYLVGFGFIGAIGLGLSVTSFEKILPILDCDGLELFKNGIKFNIYFADFSIVFFFAGNLSTKKSVTKPIFFSFLAMGLFVILYYIILYGIYENMSTFQSHGLSDLTQLSLLGLGIGRVDWFLVLFTFISTFISTALFAWIVCTCVTYVFGIKQSYLLSAIVLSVIYLLELLVITNIQKIFTLNFEYFWYFTLFFEFVLPLIVGLIALLAKKKIKNQNNKQLENLTSKVPKKKKKEAKV